MKKLLAVLTLGLMVVLVFSTLGYGIDCSAGKCWEGTWIFFTDIDDGETTTICDGPSSNCCSCLDLLQDVQGLR